MVDPNLTAMDYLLESSKGEKFEFIDLPFEDDGPFGGDEYHGVARLPDLDEDPSKRLHHQSGLQLVDFFNAMTEVTLNFIDREEWPLQWSNSYHYANMLLIATPCDPKGPFTISVYQDFTLCGWLTGPQADLFACDLVDRFDFGAVVVPIERLEESHSGLIFRYQRDNTLIEV